MSGTRLPNAYSAIVPDEKVRDYLLDPAHSDNQGKAGFFNRFGFTRLRWTILRDALRDHPRTKSSYEDDAKPLWRPLPVFIVVSRRPQSLYHHRLGD
ncbi:MAG TPA: hypothetical protein VN702_03370 [Acetobacteraceae bacterium]|nr:hypothetical protein [Acetobacteraceae bacterium]